MNMRTLFNQLSGSSSDNKANSDSISQTLGQFTSQLPSGLAGGAVAGGIMSLIMTNKSARKFAGTAATFGGAALLGGLAYKAYTNWQSGRQNQVPIAENSFTSAEILSPEYQLRLIKGMIGAAQADGHIDAEEQKRIFQSLDKMDLTTETKALVLDLIRQPVSIDEIAMGVDSVEQKTELERSIQVGFGTQQGVVINFMYSWEVSTIFKGLRLSKVFGRKGSVTFETNGVFVFIRGKKWKWIFPGFRDISGYKTMFSDFFVSLRRGFSPEFDWKSAKKDLQLIERIYSSI